jgi:nucleoside-diphosphate-sugar epimerase
MPARTLIIGCGYIGLPLALRLQQKGHEVTGWVHSAASAAGLAGHPFQRIITGSVADAEVWNTVDQPFDFVVHCASSGGGGEEAYQEVFVEGATLMGTRQPDARRLLVSSTSVYGQTDGEVVTEASLTEPCTATGKLLRQAETTSHALGTTVVRSSGIYGPGRGVLFDKFRRGEAVIEGDGTRWTNQIHQHDLVAALEHLIKCGAPGEVYNASDDTPVTYLDYYAWCAEFLHRPMPPFGPVKTQRKRGLTNKRVSNAKLRGTGWTPLYPSFREGLSTDFKPSHPSS